MAVHHVPQIDNSHPVSQYEVVQQQQAAPAGTGMFQDYIARSEVSSGWKCNICGKECAQKVNLVKHVESFHFPDSFAQECKYCGQMFNTKDKRYKHEQINHKN